MFALVGGDRLARGHVQGREQGGGARPDVVVGLTLGTAGIIGSTGAERFSAWIWDFSLITLGEARSPGDTVAANGTWRFNGIPHYSD